MVALCAWEKQYDRREPWIRDAALATYAAGRAQNGWHAERLVFVETFRVELPIEWDYHVESHPDARRRLIALATAIIDAELAHMPGAFVGVAREKVEPLHYTWLARHVLLGQSPAEIVKDYTQYNDAAAVRMAIERTARLIGLKLRPLPRGRPRGRRNAHN